MNFLPVSDIGWGTVLYYLGITSFPYVVVWTLLSEAFTLHRLKFHQSFGNCLKISIAANFVSGAVGLIWQFHFSAIEFYIPWFENLGKSLPREWWNWGIFIFFAILLLLIIGWIGSILLESIILIISEFILYEYSVINLSSIKKISLYVLKVSAIINTVSYVGLIVAMVLWYIVPLLLQKTSTH
jgi:hypothetical protein